MATIGCKYCGSPLPLSDGNSVSICPSCGMQTTLPVLEDLSQAEAFQTGNTFRLTGQYEQGRACFDRFLAQHPQNAEAYWQRALCRFGVTYHEDPASCDYVPVCRLADGRSFPSDSDCVSAVHFADTMAARVYRKEAARIAASCREQADVSSLLTAAQAPLGGVAAAEPADLAAASSLSAPLSPAASMQSPPRKPVPNAPAAVAANLAERGFFALEDGDPANASSFFEQALNQDLHCAQAYWGKVLLGERCSGDEELVRKHTEVLKTIQPQRVSACSPDVSRQKYLIQKYTEQKLLSADEIGSRMLFNVVFPSRSAAMRKQKDSELAFWSSQKNLQRALRNADPAFALRIESVRSRILAEYDRCIGEETEKDQKTAAQLRAAYAAHMDQCEKELEALLGSRMKEHYEAAVAMEQTAATEADFLAAAEQFRTIRNYEDAASRFHSCEDSAKAAAEAADATQKQMERKKSKRTRILLISGAAVLLLAVAAFALIRFGLPAHAYGQGEAALSEGRFEEAIRAFEKAGAYRDALDRIPECYYEQGLYLAQSGDPQGADTAFRAAGDYSNAALHIGEGFYRRAEQQMAEGDYSGAASSFLQAGGFSDAEVQAQAAYYAIGEEALAEGDAAAADEAFANAGSYSDASERIGEGYYTQAKKEFRSKHYKKAVELFEQAQGHADATDYLAKCSYQIGEDASDAERFAEAYDAYRTAEDYSDSEEKAAALLAEHPVVAHPGDVICFGTMEQDKSRKGEEALEWYVLENDRGKLLLLAKDGLDGRAFYDNDDEVSWENSSIREWLNGKFYKNNFSKKEKGKILEQEVPADDNPYSMTSAGRATTSRFFLLGLSEAERYGTALPEIMLCKVVPVADQVWTSRTNSNCWWWLRTPGNNERTAITVDSAGEINYIGSNVSYTRAAVRPAMWVDMSENS